MKKLHSKTTIILSLSILTISFISVAVYAVMEENQFIKSGFRKKVEKIESFKSRGVHSINIDCIYFTDGTSTYFNTYSVIEGNDTLTDVRVIDFISVGDSIIKHRNKAFIVIP